MSRVFVSIKQLVCSCFHILQDGFLRWARPLNTSLLLGTLADLPRGKSELVAENALLRQQLIILRRQSTRPVCTKGIASCWCFWQRPFEHGGKPS